MTLRNRRATPEKHEAANARARAWRRANRDRHRANLRAWIERNPERWKALRRSIQARRRGRGRSYDVDYAAILLGDPCCYCGGFAPTVDHIVPVAAGGDGNWENLTAACARCNAAKRDRPLLLYLAYSQTGQGGGGARLRVLG